MTVVGAGIVGVCIAHALAGRPGTAVTLVDAALPTGATSRAGMAWLNASAKRPRDYFELNFAGVREYHALHRRLRPDWIHLTGSIADEGHTPQLSGRIDELVGWGYRAERWTGEDVARNLDGAVAVRRPHELFAHYPDEGWIDVAAALPDLLARAAEGEFRYLFGSAVTALDTDGRGFDVTLADGTHWRADQLVNAAGPGADRVAGLLGRELPLAPTRGLVLRLHAPGVRLGKVLLGAAATIRPDGPDHYRVHSHALDALMGRSPAVDRRELVAELVVRAARQVPGLARARVVAEHSGVRPVPADSFSSIGRVETIPGYVEAVTHSGVTLGALVGRLVADIVLLDEVSPLLTPRFRPDRFTRGVVAGPAPPPG
ncbi:NAD(P)/FAD-dependent oxidoreductase [Pseudonocardia lacus]|uniref:NAD(P)/FAD-dependent oxidoreductase n=1 Tax=Pseudonocardia lacus TaxID=2835865 RepID=UPI001BDD1F8C|nr:FAD-dependent oxidoreductase [Pseudonocardia lacus]